MSTGGPTGQQLSGADPLATALGYLSWNFNLTGGGAGTTLTSQRIDVAAIALPPGLTITNVVLDVITAAAGTTPTGFFVGLCTATKMVAQSANLNASAKLTTLGSQAFALAAAYVTNVADAPGGLYYAAILLNGAFGTTQPAFLRGNGTTQGYGLVNPAFGNIGSGQTVLPANGAAVVVSSGAGLGWHVGVS